MTDANPDLPFSEADYDRPPRHIWWGGNSDLEGCPLYRGWRFRLVRHTSDDERKWLRERGWRFRGGWWGRRDDKPYGIGKTPGSSNASREGEPAPDENTLHVVRLYDGFDNQWIDVSEPVSLEEARRIWNDHTDEGKHKTSYEDIDYYAIFPAGTKMLFSDGFGASDAQLVPVPSKDESNTP